MSSDIGSSVALLVFLLIISALCSATETAITAVGRARLLALQERQPQRRGLYGWLMRETQGALTMTLVANNAVNIGASAVATSLTISLFGPSAVWLSTLLMTFVIVVFGEIFPKSAAMVNAERFLVWGLPAVRLFHALFVPLLWFFSGIVRFLGRILRVDLSSQHTFVTREEIEQVVSMGEVSGALEEDERRMIHGVIAFEETRAYEIMVPRTDMVAVSRDASVSEAVEVVRREGHSRLPIFEGSLDRIVGILYAKDLLHALAEGATDAGIFEFRRDPLFVPEVMRIAELFDIMKGGRVHMAIVVDEYGGTAGLVTLEDLLEEIVGEIQDEYDEETPPIKQEEEDTFLVEGQVNLEDLGDVLGDSFHAEDVDTVAGLALSLAGEFPEEGQTFRYGAWDLEVLGVEEHRVKLLRLRHRLEEQKSEEEGR